MPLIVILRFEDETLVDLVETDDEREAVAQVFAQCMRREGGIDLLPLLWAKTAEVPVERIRALAGELPPPTVEPAKRPVVPMFGLMASVRAFVKEQRGDDRDSDAAFDPLRSFFDHHGITLDDDNVAEIPLPEPTSTQLFEALKHGDERHQNWLCEAIDAVFAGEPVPAPVEHADGVGFRRGSEIGMKPPERPRMPTLEEIERRDGVTPNAGL